MLVLTRKIKEKIVINGNILIKILNINGNQVRIGINAPKEVSVHRKEIYLKIKNERNKLSGNNGSVNKIVN